MPTQTDGNWESLQNWPLIGIHAVVMDDGRVLTFGTDATGMQGGQFIYDIYDPSTGLHQTLENTTPTDIFCSAALIIPGTNKILIAGGDARPLGATNRGVADVNILDMDTGELYPAPDGDMAFQRWYPTMVSLPDGRMVMLGGTDINGRGIATPEIYTYGEGWQSLTGAVDTDLASSSLYPRAFVNDDGNIIYFATGRGNDSQVELMSLDPDGNGSLTQVGTMPFGIAWDAPAVMYDNGKILVQDSQTGLWSVDINADTPSFTRVGTLSQERNWSNMTTLADGTVLINGGTSNGNTEAGADYTAVIWDPATNTLDYTIDEANPRLYHSASVLLNDGTLLSLGGGASGSSETNYLDGQVYRPAYLYDENGNLAERPEITSAPSEVGAGQTFSIVMDDASDIARLTFVKSGAATHALNMDTRFVELDFTLVGGNTIEVQMPGLANGVTAGSWMLFAWDSNGVPSIAPMINIMPLGDISPIDGQISVDYFSANVSDLDQVDFTANPIFEEDLTEIQENAGSGSFYAGGPTDQFAARYSGQFAVQTAGQYTFFLNSDDGSRLSIDGVEIISNDGLHGALEVSATVFLEAGVHSLSADYFEQGGAALMELDWQGPGFARSTFKVNGNSPVQPGDEVADIPNQTQYLNGVGDSDIFVIAGLSTDYGWGPTEDGSGIVVWGPSGHDLLYGFETIRFSDTDVPLVAENGQYQDVANVTQYLTGTETQVETFVINGNSADYNWGPTEDGQGIVVWGPTGSDLLYDFDQIAFNDRTVELGNDTGPDGGLIVQNDPGRTQYETGTANTDRFVIDANASDYGWGATQDGQGIVVWNQAEGSHDILYDFEEIEFNNQVVQLEQPVA